MRQEFYLYKICMDTDMDCAIGIPLEDFVKGGQKI